MTVYMTQCEVAEVAQVSGIITRDLKRTIVEVLDTDLFLERFENGQVTFRNSLSGRSPKAIIFSRDRST
jgi:hypothetical protein